VHWTWNTEIPPNQRSNFRKIKIDLKSSGSDLLLPVELSIFKISPNPIAKCAQECRAAGGGLQRPTLQTQ
jgi:hypothetical protein